jgi:hypothetical protein
MKPFINLEAWIKVFATDVEQLQSEYYGRGGTRGSAGEPAVDLMRRVINRDRHLRPDNRWGNSGANCLLFQKYAAAHSNF